MIARLWHGRTPAAKAEEYERFLKVRAAPDYSAVDGLQGVYFLRKDEDEVTHFLLITLWDAVSSMKEFAGEDYWGAKYYEEDDDFLIEKEENVDIHDVFFSWR